MTLLQGLKKRAKRLKAETLALYLAARHPKTPFYAKLFVACVAAYAFSPIDLIPDFIPVLGYLDDIIIVPLGIAIAVRMIPPEVLNECRMQAEMLSKRPKSRAAMAVIIAVWLALAILFVAWGYGALRALKG